MPNNEQPAAVTKHNPAENPDAAPANTDHPELPPDALATLQRMERSLTQIRGALDATARDSAHREFSPRRLIGAILQVMVAGLVVLAAVDWLFDASLQTVLIKLAFAAVLQLATLTALLVSRTQA